MSLGWAKSMQKSHRLVGWVGSSYDGSDDAMQALVECASPFSTVENLPSVAIRKLFERPFLAADVDRTGDCQIERYFDPVWEI